MKKSLCFGLWVLALSLVTASAYAKDMKPLTCDGNQKIKVEAPSNIAGQAFDVRCIDGNPDSISFACNLPGSNKSILVSIIKTKQMKTTFFANIFAKQIIEEMVVRGGKENIAKLPRPNAVGKDSYKPLKCVFVADNSIVQITLSGGRDLSEEALVAFASGFAQHVAPIISSWKR